MKKDAYYFPHFSNARNDFKLLKVRRVLGLEGYAIYFMLLEILREQTNYRYPINGIEDLAYGWHISKEKIVAVVTNFDLFTIDEDDFFSIKLIQYLQPYIEKTDRAKKAAVIRWKNAKLLALKKNTSNANAVHLQCKERKEKESKEKESKVNESKKNTKANLSELEISMNDFVEMRKRIKKPLTDRAKELLVKKLESMASTEMERVEILNNSIMNSWQGIFPLQKSNKIGGETTREITQKNQYCNDDLDMDELCSRYEPGGRYDKSTQEKK